jgi:hypothetical protein
MELIFKDVQHVLLAQTDFMIDGSNSESITAKVIMNLTNGMYKIEIRTPPSAEAVTGERRKRLNTVRQALSDKAQIEAVEYLATFGFAPDIEQPDLFTKNEEV